MKILALRPNGRDPPFEVVLWDTGLTNHYVRIGHAEKMGFPKKREIQSQHHWRDLKTIDGIF